MYSPKGLGFENENSYLRIGNRNILIKQKIIQGQIEAVIHFRYKNAYKEYQDFMKFISKAPLIIRYQPYTDDEYKCCCELKSIEKPEKTKTGLEITVKFDMTSLWFKEINMSSNEEEEETGKKYPYQYDFKYYENVKGSILIESDSENDSGCIIEIRGKAVNPSWSHYVNNELVELGKMNMTVNKNQKLVIDTVNIPFSITLKDMNNNVIQDAYQLSDFSTQRFIQLKKGMNRISVSSFGTEVPMIAVRGNIEYASV